MSVEAASWITQLNSANPVETDPVGEGDDHIRQIKSVLKNSFPSTSTAPVIPDMSGQGGKYLTTDGADSSWGTITQTLAGLSDTTITSPSSNQVLTYNGSSWVNTSSSAFGKVVQIKSGEYYTGGSTGSSSFVNTGLSVSITPTSASNNILIMVSAVGRAGSGCSIAFRVYRGGTAIGMTSAPSINGAGAANTTVSILDIDNPNTTVSTTYHLKFRLVGGADNAQINPGSEGAYMTLMEVVA